MQALRSNLTKLSTVSVRRTAILPKPITANRISSNIATASSFKKIEQPSMIKGPIVHQSWKKQNLASTFANHRSSDYNFNATEDAYDVHRASVLDMFLMSTPVILIFNYLISDDNVDHNKSKWLETIGNALALLNEINDQYQVEKVRELLQKAQSEIDKIKNKEEKKLALMTLHSSYYHYYQVIATTDQELLMAAHHLQKTLEYFNEYAKNNPKSATKEEYEEIKALIEVHLGRLYYAMPVEKAMEYAKDAESILINNFGSNSPIAASATLVLADVYHFKEDFTRALSLYQEVLANREKNLSLDASKPEFIELLRPLISLACVNVSLNNTKQALNLLQSKFKNFKNTDSENYIYSLFNLREMLLSSRNYQVLKFLDDNLEDVLQKNKRKLGDEPFVAFYSHRGAAAAETKDWNTSLQYFEKAINILQPMIKSNPQYVPQLAELKASTAKIYEVRNTKGDVNLADKLYVEAINMLAQTDDARTELIAVSYILFLRKNGKHEKADDLVGNLSPQFRQMYEALAKEQRL